MVEGNGARGACGTRRRGYLQPITSPERFPERLVCISCESRVSDSQDGSIGLFRLALASYELLHTEGCEWIERHDPEAFWGWIERECMKRRTQTALWCHSLGHDLRLTRALEILPELGLKLTAYAIGERTSWLIWRRQDGASLVMRDLYSFLPTSLAEISEALRFDRTAAPAQTAPAAEWIAHCRSDVELTSTAVHELYDYLEREQLGTLAISGAGQAERAYRKRFIGSHSLLIHDDDEQLAREHSSCYTGRCEVWRHGLVREGLIEYDYASAYARIARDEALPVSYVGSLHAPSESRIAGLELQTDLCVMYDCKLETSVPVSPYRDLADRDQRLLWPVGKFSALLWSPEFELVREHADSVEVLRCFVYQSAPVLKEWAEWILAALADPQTPRAAHIMLKSWSRSLIGRFALRFPKWQQIVSEAPYASLRMESYGSDDGEQGTQLQVGREVFQQGELAEGGRTLPAITAYIMAVQRVKLWRVCELAGLEHVYYIDTDSLLVNKEGARALELALRLQLPLVDGLRIKERVTVASLKAPRQIILDSRPRAAGLPLGATKVPGKRTQWRAQVSESLSASLTSGHSDRVVTREQRYRLLGKDKRRRHLRGGLTEPFKVSEK